MDYGAIIASNVNEYITIENLRSTNSNPGKEGINPQNLENDFVELSIEAINLSISNANQLAPQMAAGSVERKTEAAEEAEILEEENPVPLETQANQLSRVNDILNNTYGLAAAPTNIETELALEVSRNQQQILLQNVGTQLAQVIPSSTVLSVVG